MTPTLLTFSISLVLTSAFSLWIYKWLFSEFISNKGVKIFVITVLFLPLLLYFAGSVVKNDFLIKSGSIWCFGLTAAVFMSFLELGMTKIVAGKRRIFISISLALTLISALYITITENEALPLNEFTAALLVITVLIGLHLLLYKRIITRFDLSRKNKGIVIISLWAVFFITQLITGNIAIIVAIWIHYFAFSRIHYSLGLSRKGNLILLGIFISGFIMSYQVTSFAGNIFGIRPLLLAGGYWLGIMSISLGFFFFEFFISLALKKFRKITGMVFLSAVMIVSSISIYNGSRDPIIKDVEIPLKNLGVENSGFTIIQLTDLHLGDLLDSRWFGRIVDRINKLDADLIVITGDIFGHGFNEIDELVSLFNRMQAEHGVYAVTGNHEYYTGIDYFREIIGRTDIRMLYNEMVNIGGVIELVGINDSEGRSSPYGGPDIDSAINGSGKDLPTVLLYHRPESFEDNVEKGVDLQLSGHTHAGQIPPMEWLVRLYYRYNYGLYRLKDSYIYTSSGTGVWELKMRFLSRSEIVRIVLTSH